MKRNKIIIALVACLTFGSLAATAAHLHHTKGYHKVHSDQNDTYNCFFDHNTEGLTNSQTEEQH